MEVWNVALFNTALVFLLGCVRLVSSQANSRPVTKNQVGYFLAEENAEIGTFLYQLTATDAEGDAITFKATTTLTEETVDVQPAFRKTDTIWASNITLKKELDLDNKPQIVPLYFSASDGSSESPIYLKMILTDVNDNPPSLKGLPYRTSVPEDFPLGKSLYQFQADDPDQGKGRSILYSMEAKNSVDSDDYNDTFHLDIRLGVVSLKKHLDYETKSFYHFRVSASDEGDPPCPGPECLCNGSPCNASVVDFFITVNDVEDTPPIFNRLSYSATVREDRPRGFTILTTTAVDGDRAVADPSPINYTITNAQVPFSVNPDGEIQVADGLDADGKLRNSGGLYVFNVTATETMTNQSASAQVFITIEDANDNPPRFEHSQFNGSVLENTPNGVPISIHPAINVADIDQGFNSRFKIYIESLDGNTDTDFSTIPGSELILQGSSSVTVVVNNSSKLDYEHVKKIEFKLIAQEVIGTGNALGPQRNETVVTVSVEDTNDNSPVFVEQPEAVYSVSESAPTHHVIHTFTAQDADSGEFGRVQFSMDDDPLFDMHPNGSLTVAGVLDRETQSSYYVVVTATDNPDAPDSQQRKTQLRVTVRITDANDNSPVWKTSSTTFSVSETDSVGSVVAGLRATDEDSGQNGQLDYTVLPNTNGSVYFDVRTTGDDQPELFINRSLNGFPGRYEIIVMAKDRGDEPLNSTLRLDVSVTDVNLDAPVFTRPDESKYNLSAGDIPQIEVLEEMSLDTVLYQLQAVDEGTGPNDRVYYRLVPSSNNDFKFFKVDPTTGDITATQSLDREEKDSYEIQVKAEDTGLPVSLSKTIPLKIKLLDKNDSDPVYTNVQTAYVMHVTEGVENPRIGMVPKATDDDVIDQICYYMCDGHDSAKFSLDSRSRLLSLVGSIDREVDDELNLEVLASSECDRESGLINCSVKTDSMLQIQVDVDDVDDNPPKFTHKEFSRSIPSDVQIDTEVTNLKDQVTDADIAPNNQYKFRAKKVTLSPDMEETFGNSNVPFFVTESGSVRTNILFQAQLVGYFLVEVEVYGNIDSFTDVAAIKIYIVSNEQRVRLVFPNKPGYVKGIIDDLANELSDILDLNITVGAIKSHVTSDNTQDTTKTDAFIYATEKGSEVIMSAIDLQNKLDFSNDARNLLFRYRVQKAQGLSESEDDDGDEMLRRLFVILVTVMSILIITLVLVLVNIIRMYRRRLKAATTMAYVSPKQQEMYEHPGTNKYYTAENPLFGKEIKAPELEEDRTSTDSLDVNAVDKKSPSKMSYDNAAVDPEEEQEVVLQIMDSSLSTPTHPQHTNNHHNGGLPNQNARLNKVLEEYENSMAHHNNGGATTATKTKSTAPPPPPPLPLPHMNGVGNHHNNNNNNNNNLYNSIPPTNKSHVIPGLGQDVQEAVTRFSDDGGINHRPNNHYSFPETIHEISTNHGNLEYTEI